MNKFDSISNTLILTEITNVKAHLSYWTLKASAQAHPQRDLLFKVGLLWWTEEMKGPCYLAGMDVHEEKQYLESHYQYVYVIWYIYI